MSPKITSPGNVKTQLATPLGELTSPSNLTCLNRAPGPKHQNKTKNCAPPVLAISVSGYSILSGCSGQNLGVIPALFVQTPHPLGQKMVLTCF